MKSKQIKAQIKEKVLSHMKDNQISQAQLARLVDSERRVINHQLNNDTTSLEKYIEFAEALGLNVDIYISIKIVSTL